MQLSLTGRSTIPIDDPAGSLAYPFTSRPTRHSHHSSSPHHRSGRYDVNGSHNQVDIGRIQRGLDVRTTVGLCLPVSHTPLTCILDYAPQHSQQG